VDEPSIDTKGLQSVRRDGAPLVRNLVREVIESILGTGSEVEAAALVRRRLLDVVEDKVPLEDYVIKKTLRKAMHDVCHPMTAEELRSIREALGGGRAQASGALTYAEQDQAIYAKVPLPWRVKVRLPHVLLAWRLRLKDPGSAPVPGTYAQPWLHPRLRVLRARSARLACAQRVFHPRLAYVRAHRRVHRVRRGAQRRDQGL